MKNTDPQFIDALLEKRQILLQGDITDAEQERIVAHLLFLNALNHEPITIFIDSRNIEQDDFSEFLEQQRKLHEEELQHLSNRSKQPLNTVKQWSKAEKRFDGREALKHGLIDELIAH